MKNPPAPIRALRASAAIADMRKTAPRAGTHKPGKGKGAYRRRNKHPARP